MLPYIAYLAARTVEDRTAAEQEILISRNRRFADKRFTDWYGLDGDSANPSKWDFRLYTAKLRASKTFN